MVTDRNDVSPPEREPAAVPPDPPAAVEIRALAVFASLALPGERVEELAAAWSGVRREHEALRALPHALEPSLVFDPRWD